MESLREDSEMKLGGLEVDFLERALKEAQDEWFDTQGKAKLMASQHRCDKSHTRM